ncbi:MAG: hypothetical protein IJT21_08705 [Synergistaceae bacterium]|nr:hypothetical protein [Synergistaceae bacterium]
MKKFFAFLIASLVLIACAVPAFAKVTAKDGYYIVDDAEGYAPVRNGQKKAARDEAMRMAYRDALEKAIGACVTGVTEMENFAVTRDKVFSKASGLVKNFKVISEKVDKDGVLNIIGTCRVEEKALDGVLGPDVIAMLGNPRIMILVDEKIEGSTPFISTTEGELLRVFERAGYLLVDPEQAKTLLHLDPAQAFDDPLRLTEAAKTLRADIIIVARASAERFADQRIHGIRLFGVGGKVQIKAVLTQTAYQVSSKNVSATTGKKPAQTVAGGAERCFKQAASIAADQLVYKIAYNMASAGSSLGGITVNIKIAGAAFKDVEEIEEKLRELAGKSGEVFERSYNDNLLEVDIVSQNTARKVASFLSNMGVEIESLTQQTINGRVKKSLERQSKPEPAPISEKFIKVVISDVDSFSDAGKIEDFLKDFGEIETGYKSKKLTLTIKTSSSTAREIAAKLSDNGVEIEALSNDSIEGRLTQ